MKKIELFDKVINGEVVCDKLSDIGINGTLFYAYRISVEIGNETIDFNGTIWNRDVKPIIDGCKKYGIDTITISSTFSGMNELVWQFLQNGCTLLGMKEVNAPYKDYNTGEYEKIPALIIGI